MNCSSINDLLAQGMPLSDQAKAHIAGCAACRSLAEGEFGMTEVLDPTALKRYKQIATQRLVAVRPIASDRQLTFVLLGLFLSFIVFASLPSGPHGFHVLTAWQAVMYYGAIIVGALFAASAVVQEITPGARRYFSPQMVLVVEGTAFLSVVALLFHSLSTARFVESGVGCLKLGLWCSIAVVVLFSFVLKDGFFLFPVRTGVLTGFFAGLAGVGVLAIHCPVLSIPHIWVWHLGVLPLCVAGGAGAGMLIQKISLLRNLRDRSIETQ